MATNLEQGDLIEIFRVGYKHWALYVGGGYVIHLTSTSADAKAGSSGLNSVGQTRARVKRDKLKDVVGQDKYCKNNCLDKKIDPRPIKEILIDAYGRLGQIVPYDLLKNNCEHFVTLLRYGTPQSQQADTALDWTFAAIFGAIGAMSLSLLRLLARSN